MPGPRGARRPRERCARRGGGGGWRQQRLTRGARCAGLCYCYAGIAHSYLTSDFNEGTDVPKGRIIEVDEVQVAARRSTGAQHGGTGVTPYLRATAPDGLLMSPGTTPPASPKRLPASSAESECSSGAASRSPSSLSM